MFKKAPASSTYDWPIVVNVPENGGTWSRHTFTGIFKRFTKEEADALTERIGEDKPNGEAYEPLDLVAEVMVGWSNDVVDDNDQPIPYSEKELRELCNLYPMTVGGIYSAWLDSFAKGKEKNSGRRRATG